MDDDNNIWVVILMPKKRKLLCKNTLLGDNDLTNLIPRILHTLHKKIKNGTEIAVVEF